MFRCDPNKIVWDEKLGGGAFGSIHPYRKSPEEKKWVVKAVHVNSVTDIIKSMQEIVIGFSCDHPSILPIQGYHLLTVKGKSKGWEVITKKPRMKGDLRGVINNFKLAEKSIEEIDILKFLYSLGSALEYLHKRKIAHRDIKPENILVSDEGVVQLADIGAGMLVQEDETSFTVNTRGTTPIYLAPETNLKTGKLTTRDLFKSDIWSLGVVAGELCSLGRILNKESQQAIDAKVEEKLASKYSKSCLEIILGLLQVDAQKRFGASQLIQTLEINFPEMFLINNKTLFLSENFLSVRFLFSDQS